MPLLLNVNSGAALRTPTAALLFVAMGNDARKSKITQETADEAARLKALWNDKNTLSQAAFGEQYEIGNQSAVGQFLRGETPLSIKAAVGFARGLGCDVRDFSPRLADLASGIASSIAPSEREGWPFSLELRAAVASLSDIDLWHAENTLRAHLKLPPIPMPAGNRRSA